VISGFLREVDGDSRSAGTLPSVQWQFIANRSEPSICPILKGQEIQGFD